jgi:hypothetical protein
MKLGLPLCCDRSFRTRVNDWRLFAAAAIEGASVGCVLSSSRCGDHLLSMPQNRRSWQMHLCAVPGTTKANRIRAGRRVTAVGLEAATI